MKATEILRGSSYWYRTKGMIYKFIDFEYNPREDTVVISCEEEVIDTMTSVQVIRVVPNDKTKRLEFTMKCPEYGNIPFTIGLQHHSWHPFLEPGVVYVAM